VDIKIIDKAEKKIVEKDLLKDLKAMLSIDEVAAELLDRA
jgi:hypothetical protein